MFAKAIALLAFVAAAQAVYAPEAIGYGLGHHAVGAQAEHTVRGYGGLSTVSHQSKAIVSPHSHVQKTDTRVTNDAALAYGSPAYSHGYAAPALAHGALAHGYAAPALAHTGAIAHGYAAPALAHQGVIAHGHGYAAPALAHGAYAHGYAAPALAHTGAIAHGAIAHGYAAPALAHHGVVAHGHGYAAPALAARAVAHPAGLLGSAYSAVSPAIASHTFSRTLGGYGTLAYSY